MTRARRASLLAVFFAFLVARSCWAVSFYPLPRPGPKGERPPRNAIGVFASKWGVTPFAVGEEPYKISGRLVTLESSLGRNYVLGAAFNSMENHVTAWETHLTRWLESEKAKEKSGSRSGIQVGAVFWKGGYTDRELLLVMSPKAAGRFTADLGFGVYYWDDVPEKKETAWTVFDSVSYALTKKATLNLSTWGVMLKDRSVVRIGLGTGYRF